MGGGGGGGGVEALGSITWARTNVMKFCLVWFGFGLVLHVSLKGRIGEDGAQK